MLINFPSLIKKYSLKISGVIHVGAHYGEEIGEYIENGIRDIVLFEPLTECFNVIQQKISQFDANIQRYQVALGSHHDSVIMHLSDNERQSSSILKPKVHLTHHPNVKFNGTEQVEMKTLDSFEITKHNFLNMDVQGYELEVLKGSEKTLDYIDYVYCEVNRDEVYENNAFIEQIDEFLSKYNMKRVETDWAGGIWGDAFYIKEEL